MAAECACLASLCRRRVSCTGVELAVCGGVRRARGGGSPEMPETWVTQPLTAPSLPRRLGLSQPWDVCRGNVHVASADSIGFCWCSTHYGLTRYVVQDHCQWRQPQGYRSHGRSDSKACLLARLRQWCWQPCSAVSSSALYHLVAVALFVGTVQVPAPHWFQAHYFSC
jgi:hypothetical protein